MPIKGMRRDVAPSQLAPGEFWTLNNWQVSNGQMTKVAGWSTTRSQLSGAVSLIGAAKYGDNTYQIVAGTSDYIYWLMAGGTIQPLNQTPFQAPAWMRWQVAVWQNKLYLTNRLNPVQVWDGKGSAVTPIAAAAPKGKTIAQFQNHLLLGDVVDKDGNAPDGFAGSGLPTTGGANDCA